MTAPINIVCQLDTKVSAKQADLIATPLRKAVLKAFPEQHVRGVWVHQDGGPIHERLSEAVEALETYDPDDAGPDDARVTREVIAQLRALVDAAYEGTAVTLTLPQLKTLLDGLDFGLSAVESALGGDSL